VDNELDLMRNLEIERHFQECPACADAHRRLQALRATIRSEAPYFAVPTGLRQRILTTTQHPRRVRPLVKSFRRPWLALAASVLIVLVAGWGLVRLLPMHSGNTFLTEQLVASHVRSQLLASHRFDVESSDQHTVKPWFEGRLDFSPSVYDLSDQGYPLAGGRLDYLDQKSVAALVYYRRRHLINLFIWPSELGMQRAPQTLTRQGYQLVHWADSGMTYWAVSNLNMAELQQFAQLFQDKAR
jgi:anti-sigma factor RsiW